jgi:hypothetical protein
MRPITVPRLRRAALATAGRATLGLAAIITMASPALAAGADAAPGTPTISAPASRTGFGTVAITGTAAPGATVNLLGSAVKWNALEQLQTTTANSSGAYRFTSNVDTGFLFAVEADGVTSATRRVNMRVLASLKVTSGKSGVVTAAASADPGQPFLTVKIQRQNANGTWSVVAQRNTNTNGAASATLRGQGSGKTRTYRAWISGDAENGMTSNYSPARKIRVR